LQLPVLQRATQRDGDPRHRRRHAPPPGLAPCASAGSRPTSGFGAPRSQGRQARRQRRGVRQRQAVPGAAHGSPRTATSWPTRTCGASPADIEATLVDSGRKSIAWSDIVTLALSRLENIDPVSAHRLAANYTDETGAVRFDRSAPEQPSPQLGLPLGEPDD